MTQRCFKTINFCLVLALAPVLLPLAPTAAAEGLFDPCLHSLDTGADPGFQLAPGSIDPDWTVISGPVTGPAIVYEAVPGSYIDAPPAQWLAPRAQYAMPSGTYVFEHTFWVGASAVPLLDVDVAVDNNVHIYLNGNLLGSLTGSSTANFRQLHTIATVANFLPGQTNSLQLHVHNAHHNSPMGVVLRGEVDFCAPPCNPDASYDAARAFDVGVESIVGGATVNDVAAARGASRSDEVVQRGAAMAVPPASAYAQALASSAWATAQVSHARASIADLDLWVGVGPGITVQADAIEAEADASLAGTSAAGSRLVNLRINSQVITQTPAPNTVISITPDIRVVLNEQIVDPSAPGIEVNMIHIYIGLAGNQVAEVIIGHAHAACGPVPGDCAQRAIGSTMIPVEPCSPCLIEASAAACVGNPCDGIHNVECDPGVCWVDIVRCVREPCRAVDRGAYCKTLDAITEGAAVEADGYRIIKDLVTALP